LDNGVDLRASDDAGAPFFLEGAFNVPARFLFRLPVDLRQIARFAPTADVDFDCQSYARMRGISLYGHSGTVTPS
jgi:hypothetical protein